MLAGPRDSKLSKLCISFISKRSAYFPVGVFIISTKHHFLLIVTRDIYPKLDLHCIPLLVTLGRFEEADHLLGALHIVAELLPFRIFYEVIIMCIIDKLYWVIAHHHRHRITSDGPILPIDQHFMD